MSTWLRSPRQRVKREPDRVRVDYMPYDQWESQTCPTCERRAQSMNWTRDKLERLAEQVDDVWTRGTIRACAQALSADNPRLKP